MLLFISLPKFYFLPCIPIIYYAWLNDPQLISSVLPAYIKRAPISGKGRKKEPSTRPLKALGVPNNGSKPLQNSLVTGKLINQDWINKKQISWGIYGDSISMS